MISRHSKEFSSDLKSRSSYADLAATSISSTSQDEVGQLIVNARVRPTNKIGNGSLTLSVDSKETTVFVSRSNEEPMSLQFNHAFGPEASQAHVYRKSFAHLADSIFQGYPLQAS